MGRQTEPGCLFFSDCELLSSLQLAPSGLTGQTMPRASGALIFSGGHFATSGALGVSGNPAVTARRGAAADHSTAHKPPPTDLLASDGTDCRPLLWLLPADTAFTVSRVSSGEPPPGMSSPLCRGQDTGQRPTRGHPHGDKLRLTALVAEQILPLI